MIKAILSDFSWTILFPKDKSYQGTLNGLHAQLLENKRETYQFFDYFEINQELLDFYQSLKPEYSINIFTSGIVQEHPQVKKILEPIFDHIFSAKHLNLSKNDPKTYLLLALKINLKPKEILFIDDQEKNLQPAQEAGLQTLLFKNDPSFLTKIKKNLSFSL